MSKLKVYGWGGYTPDPPYQQARMIVAAKSQAEVARIAGVKRPAQLWNLTETQNDLAIATAMAEPGTVFYRDINDYDGPYTRLESKK